MQHLCFQFQKNKENDGCRILISKKINTFTKTEVCGPSTLIFELANFARGSLGNFIFLLSAQGRTKQFILISNSEWFPVHGSRDPGL